MTKNLCTGIKIVQVAPDSRPYASEYPWDIWQYWDTTDRLMPKAETLAWGAWSDVMDIISECGDAPVWVCRPDGLRIGVYRISTGPCAISVHGSPGR